ncbi:hypothetical protein MNBD_GAMMA12-2525 [hydrothermal vent metagenome]|uniref:non-specific serine/threonine protein kinase n=1 Tax=hydrothermal vent metagenome TaxID=652676 RepID=A0A3B0YHD4_9ZZZZ
MRTQNINHSLANGSKIDTYEIIESIGSGGFGITYKAQDTHLQHLVAIKEYLPVQLAWRSDESSVIPRTDSDTESFEYGMKQFIEEGRTLAKFKHTNIVRVIRYFKTNGTAYLVMEYEQGQTLKEYLQTHPQPDEATLLGLMTSILKGLKAIHDQGFLHRDIKPSNIYLRDEGEPLLIDFGSARQALTRQTQSLTGIVTEGFAPFEQYTGNIQQTPATDLYGLGATLYHALSNTLPLNALDRFNSLHVNSKDPLLPCTQAGAAHYSHFFLTLIDWLLEIYPENRPQTVGAVIETLHNQNMPDLSRTQVNTRLHAVTTDSKSRSISKKTLLLGSLGILSLLAFVGYLTLLLPTSSPTLTTDISNNNNTSSTNTTSTTKDTGNPFSKHKKSSVRYMTELLVVKGGNYFQIESKPPGSKVYINDVYQGTTPYVFKQSFAGHYKITLKKVGYIDSHRAIYKVQNYSYLYKPTLHKVGYKAVKKYSLNIKVSPQNAQIKFIGSKHLYADDMRLAKGRYTVRVTSINHKPLEKTFDIDYADRKLKIALSHTQLLRTQKFSDWVEHIIPINGETAIVGVNGKHLRSINLNSGKVVREFENSKSDKPMISKDRLQLFTANRDSYQLWDLKQGKQLVTKKVKYRFQNSILFSAKRSGWIKTNQATKELKFFTFDQYPVVTKTIKLTEDINNLFDLSANENLLLTTSYSNNNNLYIIDIEQQKIVITLKGYDWQNESAAFTPDGKQVISLDNDGKLRLWNLQTKKPVWTSSDRFYAYTTLAVSSDGRLVATATNYDSILILDLSTGKVIANLAGHTDTIKTLTFFAKDKKLASGSDDNTLRIWDIAGVLKLNSITF